MAQTNYREMKRKLESRTTFNGNSARAVIDGEHYLVYSYNTLILKWNIRAQAQVYFNAARYSSTTSRLQNMIRAAFNVQES